MTKLYEITNDYQQILVETLEDGLEEKDIQDKLDLIKSDFETKVISIGKFINNINSDIDQLKEYELSLNKRRKILENRIKSIKEYLLVNMQNIGIKHISCPYFDVKIKKNGGKCKIIDSNQLPEKYISIKQELLVDKKKLLEDLKSGEYIEGVELDITERVEIK